MNLYHLLGEGAGAASIAVGFIALVGALAGALTSYLVAGRAVYVNTITVERSKWINKLRGNLAAYSAAIAQVKFRIVELSLPGEERDRVARIVDKMEGINHIASQIQLQLNPWGVIDKNILKLISSIFIRTDGNVGLLIRADELLIAHSQWLLKAEWEKVKFEAGGPIYRFCHRNDEARRINDYEKWVVDEGGMNALLDDMAFERERP